MKRLALALLMACAGQDSVDGCRFDGTYEFGGIEQTGRCENLQQDITYHSLEDDCNSASDDVSVTGQAIEMAMSCEPGDPVLECDGIATRSDGCQWKTYLRRRP